MPRRARMYVPGLAYHVVQRGNNRQACFFDPASYRHYLVLWQSVAARYGTRVHAYCLMTNHVHFLVTPARADSVSNTMKVVGSRYAQHINQRFGRTGTLWEGRHRSSLVQTERYLLACYRYIELNPVRAGMVARPHDYPWSSYRFNALGEAGWVDPHEEYLALAGDQATRCRAYRDLFGEVLREIDLRAFRQAAHYCQPVGDEKFRRSIELDYGIKLGRMHRGRPRKDRAETVKH